MATNRRSRFLGNGIQPPSPQHAAPMKTPHAPPRTEPRPATPSSRPLEESSSAAERSYDETSLNDRAIKDVKQSLDAMGRVCTPVLFGLLAPGGLAGGLLLAWMLFS